MKSKFAITGLTEGSNAHKWLEYATLDVVPISDPDHYHFYDSGVVTVLRFSESNILEAVIYSEEEFSDMLEKNLKDGPWHPPRDEFKTKETMSAERFVLHHFPEMDKKCVWYPVIVAVAEGYLNYIRSQQVDDNPKFKANAYYKFPITNNPSAKLESYNKEYELLKDYEDPNGWINKGVVKKEYQWMSRFALLNPGDCGVKTDWFKEVVKSTTRLDPSTMIFEKKADYPKDAFKYKEGPVQEHKAIPYQTCPVCNGQGRVTSNGATSNVFDVCSVCNGAKIIPMHIFTEESGSYSKVSSEYHKQVVQQVAITSPDKLNKINITNLIRDYMINLLHTRDHLFVSKFKVQIIDPEIENLFKKYNVTRK